MTIKINFTINTFYEILTYGHIKVRTSVYNILQTTYEIEHNSNYH